MARQLCCRGMCKNLLRSDGQQRKYNKVKFLSNLNCGQKSLVKRAPGSNFAGRWIFTRPRPEFPLTSQRYHARVIASHITGNATLCLTDCASWQQRKHQSITDLCEENFISHVCARTFAASVAETLATYQYCPHLIITYIEFNTIKKSLSMHDTKPQTPPHRRTSNHIHSKAWDKITYPFLSFQDCAIEVWEWICNLVPYFIMDGNTYPCWDQSQSILIKGAPEGEPLTTKIIFFDLPTALEHDSCVTRLTHWGRDKMNAI